MSTFFRGITETIPSLFRGIFSEQNSVANPSLQSRQGSNLSVLASIASFHGPPQLHFKPPIFRIFC
jgi:hypothetical protein